MVLLNPYLNFSDGSAQEALNFYHGVFGGELTLMRFGDMPDMPGNDPSLADLVMHGQVTTPELTLMCSDTPPSMGEPSPHCQISLSGGPEDEATLRGYFSGLAEGGAVTLPLDQAPWGDWFGMVQDRFGVSWVVNIGGTGAQQ